MKKIISLLLALVLMLAPVNVMAYEDIDKDRSAYGKWIGTANEFKLDNMYMILEFLMDDLDYSTAVSVGILANMRQECSFNPAAESSNGVYFGLCQWGKGRRDKLNSFCSQYGLEADSLPGQLLYLRWELYSIDPYGKGVIAKQTADTSVYLFTEEGYKPTTRYNNLFQEFDDCPNTCSGAKKAACAFSDIFEQPSNTELEHQRRSAHAEEIYYYLQGWRVDASGNWRFASAGSYKGGWVKLDMKWYYFDPSTYIMRTGLIKDGGRTYAVSSNGILAIKKWIKIDGKWYITDKNGMVRTGIVTDGGKNYAMDTDGSLAVNKWIKISGKWYHTDKNGELKTNVFLTSGGYTYYLGSDGAMLVNCTVTIDGASYTFNKSGRLV